MDKRRRYMPARLLDVERRKMVDPVRNAVIALRMGRARETHFHDLSYHLMLAHKIAEAVHRHNHLTVHTQAGINALGDVFDRWRQRTIKDGFVGATDVETEALDLAHEVYDALLKTTRWKTIVRSMRELNDAVKAAKEQK